MIANGVILMLFISMALHHQAFYKIFAHTIEHRIRATAATGGIDEKFIVDLIHFNTLAKE